MQRNERKIVEMIATISPEVSYDVIYENKFHLATSDLKKYRINQLKRMNTNTALLVNYINSRMREGNLKPASRASTIDRLYRLSIFHKNKSFREMTTKDIFSYLDTLRKTDSEDPMHKWIGTYNLSVIKIQAFFKWLSDPDTNSKDRITPSFLTNLRCLKRKEKTTCSPKDLWTNEADLLFLKYCPEKRLRLYHIMARETSGRPSELLSLKIGDVIIHSTEEGRIYATVTIGIGGKTIPRTVPLINSIPYLKDYLNTEHQQGDSKNHFLFPSLNRRSKMRNKNLDSHSLNVLYSNMKSKLFPRLLEDPNLPDSDKEMIKNLLAKPFYPYLRRHIGITDKATKISDHALRLYCGWQKSSKMPEIYTHELGDEVSNQILELEGIKTRSVIKEKILSPKICPNCQEPNKPGSGWCFRCKMILSYDAYTDILNMDKQKEERLVLIEERCKSMETQIQGILNGLGDLSDDQKVSVGRYLLNKKILQVSVL